MDDRFDKRGAGRASPVVKTSMRAMKKVVRIVRFTDVHAARRDGRQCAPCTPVKVRKAPPPHLLRLIAPSPEAAPAPPGSGVTRGMRI
jgi:hypothetical protein